MQSMEIEKNTEKAKKQVKSTVWTKIVDDYKKHKIIYLLLIPVILYYAVFEYGPLGGLIIAFKDYRPARGIFGSAWADDFGFEHFITFFESYYFWDLIRNTITISITSIAFGFPAPIILALLLNEVKKEKFKRVVQTVTYMPHFISAVVVCGIIIDLVSTDGVITDMLVFFGMDRRNLLTIGEFFVPIFVTSDIWQNIGWGTIIYLSALSAISPELYEAASIDGATRFKQVFCVTLPGIAPTIVTLFILRIGRIMNVGWEKIILLSNPSIKDSSQVISSFVYENGLLNANYSYSAAVGLFNSIICFVLLIIANNLSRKLNETSLW